MGNSIKSVMLESSLVRLIVRLTWFITGSIWLGACQITSVNKLEPSSNANTQTVAPISVPTNTSVPSLVPTTKPEPPYGTLIQVIIDDVDLFDGASSWQASGAEYLGGAKFSPDGSNLAMVSSEGVMIYDATSFALLTVLETVGTPHVVEWSEDGALLAVRHGNNVLSMWEPASNTRVSSFWLEYAPIYGNLALSPEGERMAALTTDGKKNPAILDSGTGDIVLELESDDNHYCPIFAFSPDGQLLAGGCSGREVVIWETVAGTWLFNLDMGVPYEVLSSWTTDLAWSPHGDRVAFAVVKGHAAIMIYDANTGQTLTDISTPDTSEIFKVAWLPDEKHVLCASYDDIIRIWDIEKLEEIKVIDNLGNLDEVAVSPDGKHLIVIRADGLLIRIDMVALLEQNETP